MMFYVLVVIGLVVVDANACSLGLHRARSLEKWRGRIIGGRKANIEEFPYHVALEHFGSYKCGGAILTRHHVITAGHCVIDMVHDIQNLKIRAGATMLYDKPSSLHNVTKFFIHENFKQDEFENSEHDVAVLRVEPPIEIDMTRQTIQMFDYQEKFKHGSMATVTGWGITEHGRVSSQLRTVDLPLINAEICDVVYKKFGGLYVGTMCAGYLGIGNKDACAGDSGGPLVFKDRLVGLVSYGEDCATPKYPGVYTEIAYFRKWIDEKIKLSSYAYEANEI